MALPQGIDFRATSGYVTDPTSCDYEIGTTANFGSHTTAQGNNVGWEDAPSGTRDRNANTGDAAKVAGVHFVTSAVDGTAIRYRIDLPATGDYKFRIAAGDGAGTNGAHVELFDTTTSLGNFTNRAATAGADQFYDATDVQRTSAADWVTNNALSAAKTFASTICRFKIIWNTGMSSSVIAHIWVEAVGGGGGTRQQTLTMLGVGA